MSNPTHQQREEFRAFMNAVISSLSDALPYVEQFPAKTYEDESGGAFVDPAYVSTLARIRQTVSELEALRGKPGDEWLAAYMERKRVQDTPATSFYAHMMKKYQHVTD